MSALNVGRVVIICLVVVTASATPAQAGAHPLDMTPDQTETARSAPKSNSDLN